MHTKLLLLILNKTANVNTPLSVALCATGVGTQARHTVGYFSLRRKFAES